MAKVLMAVPDLMSIEDTLVEVAEVNQAIKIATSPYEYHNKAFKLMIFSEFINSKVIIANPTETFANTFIHEMLEDSGWICLAHILVSSKANINTLKAYLFQQLTLLETKLARETAYASTLEGVNSVNMLVERRFQNGCLYI